MIKGKVIGGGTSIEHERWVIEEIGMTPIEALVGLGLILTQTSPTYSVL